MTDHYNKKGLKIPDVQLTLCKPLTKEEEEEIIRKVHDELIAEGYGIDANGKYVAPKDKNKVHVELIAEGYGIDANGKYVAPKEKNIEYYQLANGYIVKIDKSSGNSYIFNSKTNEWNQEDIYYIAYEHGNFIGKRKYMEDHYPIGPNWNSPSGKDLSDGHRSMTNRNAFTKTESPKDMRCEYTLPISLGIEEIIKFFTNIEESGFFRHFYYQVDAIADEYESGGTHVFTSMKSFNPEIMNAWNVLGTIGMKGWHHDSDVLCDGIYTAVHSNVVVVKCGHTGKVLEIVEASFPQ